MNKMMKQKGRLTKLRREAHSLTQTQLARKARISQPKLSRFEQGMTDLDQGELRQLAQALETTVDYFELDEPVRGAGVGIEMFYRRRKGIGKRLLSAVESRLELTRLALAQVLPSVDVEAEFEVPQYTIEDDGSAAEIARFVRLAWRIPSGPIDSMIRTLEAAGILVVPFDFGTDRIDAVSVDAPKMRPLVFINPNAPGCRLRFNLGHELGHIVCHTFPTVRMEEEAHEFSGEFLLPTAEFKRDMKSAGRLSLADLAAMKRYWRVSMAMIATTASKRRLITEWNYKSLMMQLSERGWRKNEPDELAVEIEQPRLIHRVMSTYARGMAMTLDEVAAALFLPLDQVRVTLFGERGPVGVVRRISEDWTGNPPHQPQNQSQ